MLYRCLKCEHEVAAGCLPTVRSRLYFVGLMAVGPVVLGSGLAMLTHRLIPAPPPPPDGAEPDFPWCPVLGISFIVGPVITLGGAWALDLLFRTVERLLMRRTKCPKCGSRAWSEGYTSGFEP